MDEIYTNFKDQVEFFLIYVREAHPTDGWQVDANVEDDILFRQHQTTEEREEVATTFCSVRNVIMPTLIEEIDNGVDDAYGAAPTRLYLVGADGKVAYHGGAGPHFFDPEEWAEAIQAEVKALVK